MGICLPRRDDGGAIQRQGTDQRRRSMSEPGRTGVVRRKLREHDASRRPEASERLGPVRYAGQRLGMVRGRLARQLPGAPSNGSAWLGEGRRRVYRGGSWAGLARYCRCACRAAGGRAIATTTSASGSFLPPGSRRTSVRSLEQGEVRRHGRLRRAEPAEPPDSPCKPARSQPREGRQVVARGVSPWNAVNCHQKPR